MESKKIKMNSNFIIFILMGITYIFIEVCFTALNGKMYNRFSTARWSMLGYSSIYMFFIGGFLGMILGNLNEIKFIRNNLNLFFQSFLGAIIITIVELVSGLILNVWLKFDIWDYSNHLLNFMGQICFSRSILWFFLSPLVFWFDDLVRSLLYNEGEPYSLIRLYLKLFYLTSPNLGETTKKL